MWIGVYHLARDRDYRKCSIIYLPQPSSHQPVGSMWPSDFHLLQTVKTRPADKLHRHSFTCLLGMQKDKFVLVLTEQGFYWCANFPLTIFSHFRRVRLLAKSAGPSSCNRLSGRGVHWTDFREIWYWEFFVKISRKNPNFVTIFKKSGASHENLSKFDCCRRH